MQSTVWEQKADSREPRGPEGRGGLLTAGEKAEGTLRGEYMFLTYMYLCKISSDNLHFCMFANNAKALHYFFFLFYTFSNFISLLLHIY